MGISYDWWWFQWKYSSSYFGLCALILFFSHDTLHNAMQCKATYYIISALHWMFALDCPNKIEWTLMCAYNHAQIDIIIWKGIVYINNFDHSRCKLHARDTRPSKPALCVRIEYACATIQFTCAFESVWMGLCKCCWNDYFHTLHAWEWFAIYIALSTNVLTFEKPHLGLQYCALNGMLAAEHTFNKKP